MSDYEKWVLGALKNGPRTGKELIEELCPQKMSEKKLHKTLKELEDEERIICRPKRTDIGPKWTSIYALPKHLHLLEVDYSEVARAVKDLRLELCRNPEVEEVAAKVGKDPGNVRAVLFEHAPELRWMPPTPSEKEGAEKSREIAGNLAAIIKYSLEKDYSLEARKIFWDEQIPRGKISAEDLKRALFLLEHRFESIKEEDIPFIPSLIGRGIHIGPSKPRERSNIEAIDVIKKFCKTNKISKP